MKKRTLDYAMAHHNWFFLCEKMRDEYDTKTCFNNVDDDNPIDEEGLWFECPICGEPILCEDWENDTEVNESVFHQCPICGMEYE